MTTMPRSNFSILIPEEPRIFYGREVELDVLLSSIRSGLHSKKPARIVIRGSGGMGKTTLALSILHHEDTKIHFGPCSFFVSCEATDTPSLLVTGINRALKLAPSESDPLIQLRGYLRSFDQVAMLVLDNFETPWLGEDQENVQRVLALLDSCPYLTLLLTTRVNILPYGIQWTKPHFPPLQPFSLDAARYTFNDITGEDSNNSSSDLDKLLEQLDLVPLAVTLMASAAQSGESLVHLQRAWNEERTSLLSSGSSNKNTDLEASIKVSLESRPVGTEPNALRLLALLCLLPDGAARSHLSEMTGMQRSGSAVRILKNFSLIYEDRSTLKVLSPIRAYILSNPRYPVHEEDRKALILFYTVFAMRADCWPGQGDVNLFISASELLPPERGNLHSILSLAIREGPPSPELVRALFAYTQFLGIVSPSADLLKLLLSSPDWDQNITKKLQAEAMDQLGIAYIYMDKHSQAIEQLQRTREFCLKESEPLEAAFCLRNMGLAYRRQGKHEEALEALRLAEKELLVIEGERAQTGVLECKEFIGFSLITNNQEKEAIEHQLGTLDLLRARNSQDRLLLAQVLRNLAMANMELGDTDSASAFGEESLAEMRGIGWVQGEGMVLWVLGMVMLQTEENEDARVILQESSTKLLRGGGNQRMAAAALNALGLACAALKRADEVRDAHGQAIKVYEDLNLPHQRASSIQNLASSLSACADSESIQCYQEARLLFLELSDMKSAAHCLHGEAVDRRRVGGTTPQELAGMHRKAKLEFCEAGDLHSASWAQANEGIAYVGLDNNLAALWSFRIAEQGLRETGDDSLADFAKRLGEKLVEFDPDLERELDLATRDSESTAAS